MLRTTRVIPRVFGSAARQGQRSARAVRQMSSDGKEQSKSRVPVSWKTLGGSAMVLGGAAIAFQYVWNQKQYATTQVQSTATGMPMIGGPFTLVDESGRIVTDKDFQGQYVLVYFGFSYCPDICPSELVKMDKVIKALDASSEVGPIVQPVMISVDPKRDCLAQLRFYARDFNPRLKCLTGTPDQVEVAAKAYRVYFNKADQQDEEDMDYVVDHSIVMYLMGKDGEFVDFFTQMAEPDEIVAKIKDHVKSKGK